MRITLVLGCQSMVSMLYYHTMYIHDPAQNDDVTILDRKTAPARFSKKLDSVLFIPGQSLIVRKNCFCELVHPGTL
jgi:hypothetical protein